MNNMPSALHKQFLLHARKPAFQKHVDVALKTIKAFLEKAQNPYIAVSGGKDSSVLLSLCRRIHPNLDAVHLDFHTAYPETLALFETYENLKFIDVGSRLEMLEAGGTADTSKKGKIRNFDVKRISAEGYDGYFYGLRAEESSKRRMLQKSRGNYFQRKDGLWVCQPIVNFLYEDIWAYIVSEKLPYNAFYDGMWDRPKHQQRVADYALVKEANNGSVAYLKMTHPELFNKIVQKTDEFRNFV